jgi:TPR repeat protein
MVCMCNHRVIAPRISIALVLSIVLLAAPAWADFKAGEKAYQSGDYSTALREWQPLAEQGQADSQYQLGLLYANGKGVTKDDAKARLWYEKAAIQGHTEARVNFGVMLMYARGGQQDYKMAVYYLRLAANEGHDVAQRRLGELYQRGEGVQQDFIKAYMWYSLGSAHGAEAGARLRDALAKQMDPDQIAEAQKLVREWKPKTK